MFGRSTTGGAVLIVPQAPTNTYGGYMRAQGGTYGDFQFEGAINIPLIDDKLILRVADFYQLRDGYSHTYANEFVENAQGTGFIMQPTLQRDTLTGLPLGSQTYNSINQNEVRATLLFRPTDKLTNTTVFTYHWDHNISSAGAGIATPFNGTYPLSPGFGTLFSSTDIRLGAPPTVAWAVINTTNYDITDDLSIKNIFGYINASGYPQNGVDADGYFSPGISLGVAPYASQNWQTTDEVQLHGSSFNHRLTWIVGGLVDYTREPTAQNQLNFNSPTYTQQGCDTTNPVVLSTFLLHNASCGILGVLTGNNFNSYGIFGSGTFKVTDQVDVTAGYRHSWNEIQELTGTSAALITAAGVYPTQAALCCTPGSYGSFTTQSPGDSYDFGVNYHPTNRLMVYGGYRHGFKHGGFNQSALNSGLQSFASETVDDFYVGAKTQFNFNGIAGRFNIEFYDDLYHNQQTSYLDQVPSGQLTTVTANVPKSTYRGFDVDLAVDPTSWLTITAGWSYLDAKINSWPDVSCAVVVCRSNFGAGPVVPPSNIDLSVNPAALASQNKVNASFRFHTDLGGDRGELALTPTVNMQSHFYATTTAVVFPQAEQLIFGNVNSLAHGGVIVPGVTTVDLRAEWNHVWGSRVSAALMVTNLTNKIYVTGNGGTIQFGGQDDAYAPPRMITFELSTKW